MSLIETVAANCNLGFVHNAQNYLPGKTPKGVDYPQPVSCHNATIAWLMTDINGVQPTANDLPGDTTSLVSSMLARGIRKTQPSVGSLTVIPGSVIVFAINNVAQHSCIALDPTTVAGYNQVDWFFGGKQHSYTAHLITQLKWNAEKSKKNQVLRHQGGTSYDLWQVPGDAARAIVEGL